MKKLLLVLLLVLSITLVGCDTQTTEQTEDVKYEELLDRVDELEAIIDELELALNDVNNNTYYNYEFIEDLVSRIDELENELKELTP